SLGDVSAGSGWKAKAATRIAAPITLVSASLPETVEWHAELHSHGLFAIVVPAAVACVTPTVEAALIVDATSAPGTAAAAHFWGNRPPSVADVSTTPRRVSRLDNSARARISRLDNVPSGQPICRAASRCVLPATSQSNTGRRYLSGRLFSSRSNTG